MRDRTPVSKSGRIKSLVLAGVGLSLFACGEDQNPLAPYQGQRQMSQVVVEANSYVPRVTWVGGYVSVIGVNRDTVAALNSSLVWLIHTNGDDIHYPVTFGQTPAGAQDLTSQFGGQKIDRLEEDNVYTFWVLKAEAWSQVSANANKRLVVDQGSASVAVRADTVFVSPSFHAQTTEPLDVYVNIKNFRSFGRLATLTLQQTNTSNDPIIRWTIVQAGVTDSLVAAMGLADGTAYVPDAVVWETWSRDDVGGQTIYGKNNVISQPVIMGQLLAGTQVFHDYPAQGLERDKDYYVWIANKDWDGVRHGRTVNSYAYATFQTY